MTATVTTLRPRLDSPRSGPTTRALGANVQVKVLDLIERLLEAAEHPDIAGIERYGPDLGPWGPGVSDRIKSVTGIMVTHRSTATASLWEAVWPGETPVKPPAVLPPPRQNRAPRLLILVNQLLDVARPEQLRSWQLVALPDLGDAKTQTGLPFGLSVVSAGGQKLLLRATATGPSVGQEPDEEPFPDYVIPEGVKTCLRSANAVSAAPV